jgi:hypothetical protein
MFDDPYILFVHFLYFFLVCLSDPCNLFFGVQFVPKCNLSGSVLFCIQLVQRMPPWMQDNEEASLQKWHLDGVDIFFNFFCLFNINRESENYR